MSGNNRNNCISIGAYRHESPAPDKFLPHAHDLWELIYVIRGNVSCAIEGRKYPLQAHSLMIVRPAYIHRVHIVGNVPYEFFSMWCDASDIVEMFDDMLDETVEVINFGEEGQIYELFQSIYGSYDRNSDTENLHPMAEALFTELLEAAAGHCVQSPVSENPIVRRATEYISDHIMDMMTVDEICVNLGITWNRLYNLFIRHLMISPKRYIQAKRLALMQMVLREGEDPSHLLQVFGYKDEKSFKNAYRRFYSNISE